MWSCPRCHASLEDESTVCPTCRIPVNDEIAATPAQVAKEPDERDDPLLPLINVRTVPDILAPWMKRSVEAGFILGAGAMFLVGLCEFFLGEWQIGLGCMVSSPLVGLWVCLLFSCLAHGWKAYWHALAGDDNNATRRSIAPVPGSLNTPAQTRTDITASPMHATPDPATSAPPAVPTGSFSADDYTREGRLLPPAANRLRTIWSVHLVAVGASMLVMWLVFKNEMSGILGGGLCFGIPTGFVLSTLAMLLLRKRPRR